VVAVDEQLLSKDGRHVQQMLTVIEHEQRPSSPEIFVQHRVERLPGALADPEDRSRAWATYPHGPGPIDETRPERYSARSPA